MSDRGMPSPEAIVKAALETAAQAVHGHADDYDAMEHIRTLASDPAEVAAIIKAAGGETG